MRPSSKRPIGHSTAGLAVVVGISVKVGDFADAVSCGVRGDGADVEDAKAGLVVGLVGETVVLFVCFWLVVVVVAHVMFIRVVTTYDKLVVVDGSYSRLVVSGVDGILEVGDVEDVGHWETIQSGTVGVDARGVDLSLVEFIVEHQMRLPHGVDDPSLVRVCRSSVRRAGDDGASVRPVLVGHIVNGQGVFVVAIADVSAIVPLIGPTVLCCSQVSGVIRAREHSISLTTMHCASWM